MRATFRVHYLYFLGHFWFGNYVTMKFWDDLWLKEGFATYMSYVAMNNVSL